MRPHIDIPARSDGRRRRRVRIRTLTLAIVAAAAWFVAMRAPGVGPLVLGVAAGAGAVALLFAAVMLMGWLGFGLFALADRALAWVRRASGWPED